MNHICVCQHFSEAGPQVVCIAFIFLQIVVVGVGVGGCFRGQNQV